MASKAYRGVLKARISKLYGGDVTVSKARKLKARRDATNRDKQLEKASNTHAGQAKKINSALKKKIKRTKISAPCKAAAKRKFKVWPSAYASGWGVRCTRNPRKYLKRK